MKYIDFVKTCKPWFAFTRALVEQKECFYCLLRINEKLDNDSFEFNNSDISFEIKPYCPAM